MIEGWLSQLSRYQGLAASPYETDFTLASRSSMLASRSSCSGTPWARSQRRRRFWTKHSTGPARSCEAPPLSACSPSAWQTPRRSARRARGVQRRVRALHRLRMAVARRCGGRRLCGRPVVRLGRAGRPDPLALRPRWPQVGIDLATGAAVSGCGCGRCDGQAVPGGAA